MAEIEEGRARSVLGYSEKSVIFLGGILASLTLMAINSVLPSIDTALARTAFESFLVKELVGGVALAMVVGAPLAGYAANRIGIGRMLLIACLTYVVAGTAGLYLNDLRLLLASRLLLGIAAAAIQVTSLTLINTKLDGNVRAKWMGIHISLAMFGTLFAHPLAGLLGEMSWRLPFLLYAAGLILIPAALNEMRNDRSVPGRAGSSEANAGKTKGASIISWFPLHYIPLALIVGCTVFLPTIYAPFLLRKVGVASPALISLVLTADSIAGAAMAMAYGRARKHLSARSAFLCSFSFAAAGMTIVVLSPAFPGVFAGLFIYGIGVGWFIPNLVTSLAEKLQPSQQGQAAGIIKAAHFSAGPLSIILAEPIARHFGPAYVMLLVAVLSATMIVILGFRRGNAQTAGLHT